MGIGTSGCAGFDYNGYFKKQAVQGSVAFGLAPSILSGKFTSARTISTNADTSSAGTGPADWVDITAVTKTMLGTKTPLSGQNSTTILLRNNGELSVSGIAFSIDPPTQATNYLVTHDCTVLRGLAAKTSKGADYCTVTVTFNPQIISDEVDANLIVTYNNGKGTTTSGGSNSSGGSAGSQSQITLAGRSVAEPFYKFTVASYDFGQVILGHTATATIHLFYNGDLAKAQGKVIPPAVITTDSSGNPPMVGQYFAIAPSGTTTCNMSGGLPDNNGNVNSQQLSSCDVVVNFTASGNDGQSASTSLNFYYGNHTATINLTGSMTKINPLVLKAQQSGSDVNAINFGAVVRNQKATVPDQLIAVTGATGNQPATINNIALSGGSAQLSLVAPVSGTPCTVGMVLNPGQGCTLAVHYNTSGNTLGALAGQSLLIDYTSSNGTSDVPAELSLPVNASVIAPASVRLVTASPLALPTVPAWEQTSGAFILAVTGGTGLSSFTYLGASSPAITLATPVLNTAMNASSTMNVTLTPQDSTTTYSSTYKFSYDDGTADGTNPYTIQFVVTGGGNAPIVASGGTTISFGNMLVGDTNVHTATQTIHFYGTQSSATVSPTTLAATGANVFYYGGPTTGPGTGGSCANPQGNNSTCTLVYGIQPSLFGAVADGTTISPTSAGVNLTFAGTGPLNLAYAVTGVLFNPPKLAIAYPTSTPNTAGTGTVANAAASASPAATISFGSVMTRESDKQPIILSNGSAGNPFNVTINSVVVSGANAGDFTTSGCPANTALTQASTSTCTILVTFAPTAGGARTATLTITYSDGLTSNRTIAFTLSGTGDTGARILVPTSAPAISALQGATGTANVTLTYAAGAGAVNISAATSSPGFAVNSSNCNTLDTGTGTTTCTITVAFGGVASSTGVSQTSSGTLNLSLAGGSVGSSSDLGSVIATPAISGPPRTFATTVNLSGTVTPKTITPITPNPGSLSLTGFVGQGAPSGTIIFTFGTSSGGGTATIVGLSALQSGLTYVNDGCTGQTKTAGQTCSVGIAMANSTTGTYSSTVTLTAHDDYGNTKTSSPVTVGGSVSQPSASIAATPSSKAFGTVLQDGATTLNQVFTYTNSGQSAATGLTVSITPDNAGGVFTLDASGCGSTLSNTGTNTCTVSVTASEATVGTFSRTLHLSYSNGITTATTDVPLSLTVNPKLPSITLSPTSAVFGKVLTGTTSNLISLQFTNVGAGTGTNLHFGTPPAPFAFASTGAPGSPGMCGANGTLAAGASCVVKLVYSPVAVGPNGSAGLTWGYSDSVGNPVATGSIALSGTGTVPIKLFAGGSSTCIIDELQNTRCWGSNAFGQAGAGTTGGTVTPAAAPLNFGAGIKATKIAIGDSHICAIVTGSGITTNNVVCWGYNNFGQLGLGVTTSIFNAPVISNTLNLVNLGASATDITAGAYHTCALLTGGAVKCWGLSNNGQLGIDQGSLDGSTSSAGAYYGTTASQMSALPNVNLGSTPAGPLTATSVVAGYSSTCAVLSSGALKCWGYNDEAQLGVGSLFPDLAGGNTSRTSDTTMANLPAVNLNGLTASAVALGKTAEFTCVLTSSQDVRCFGQTVNDTSLATSSTTPPAVGILGHVYYVQGANAAQTAMYGNMDSQMGAGLPAVVLGGGTVTVKQLAVGGTHTCVLLTGGNVRCWGFGSNGQLGNGLATSTTQIGNSSSDMSGLSDVLTGVSKIAAGKAHTCAVTTGNQVKCWGSAPPVNGGTAGTNVTAITLVYDGTQ